MAAVLGNDIGYTLWVRCDQCGEQLMAFGQKAARESEIKVELQSELENIILAEGWRHLDSNDWLCQQCSAVTH